MKHLVYVVQDRGIPLDGTKGSSIHVRSMVRAFAGLGLRVTVLTGRKISRDFDPGPRVRVRHLAGSRDDAPQTAEALDAIHAKRPIDFVYERLSLHADVASAWCARRGIAHALEVNAPLVDEAVAHRGLDDIDGARRAEANVLAASRLVLPVSPWLVRWAAMTGAEPERIRLLPNGVDKSWLTSLRDSPFAKSGEGRLRVGFIGSLRPWHDLETLLAAFELLDQNDFELEIVGGGPREEWLREAVIERGLCDRVHCCGVVPSDSVSERIDGVDVCVAPYAPDTNFYFCPIKIFEYGARARPVVAAGLPELEEQFPEGSMLFYEPGSAEALAARLAELRDTLAGSGVRTRGPQEDWPDPIGDATAGRRLNQYVGRHTWQLHAEQVLDWIEARNTSSSASAERKAQV